MREPAGSSLPRGLTALDLAGKPVSLDSLGGQAPLVLCFLRHYG